MIPLHPRKPSPPQPSEQQGQELQEHLEKHKLINRKRERSQTTQKEIKGTALKEQKGE